MALKFLDEAQVLQQLRTTLHGNAGHYKAFYSSRLGGVITDPALMVLPMDDHMVHRGHSVFDTLTVLNGRAFMLDRHIRRLLHSAEVARITLPMSSDEIKQTILSTVAATSLRACKVRYFLSVGPGSFNVFPEPGNSVLYVVVLGWEPQGSTAPAKEFTSHVPQKPPQLATIKSTNYLMNALVAMDSRANGGTFGVQVSGNGYLAEGSVANISFVLPDKTLVTVPFDTILNGTTIERVMVGAQQLVTEGLLSKAESRPIHIDEAKTCQEMFFTCADKVIPVAEWDGVEIGGPGPVTQRLQEFVWNELSREDLTDEVPYHLYS